MIDSPARGANRTSGYIFWLVAAAVIYFLAARLGLFLATINKSASPIWPASGFAVGLLLLHGKRLWPAIFVGAFLANFFNDQSVLLDLGIAAGNTLEAVVGILIWRKVQDSRQTLEYHTETVSLIAASFSASIVSATIGFGCLVTGRVVPWAALGDVWLTWWGGDAVGILLVTPLVLVL